MILIITSANILDDYDTRKNDYVESFSIINENYKDRFSSIALLESVDLSDYQNEYSFDIYRYGNRFCNKGLNEMWMLYTYFVNNSIDDNEVFIKLTGRYHIISDDLLKDDIYNYDFVGKLSDDMYPDTEGVHTFYYSMKVGKLKEFYNHIINIESLQQDFPIEIELKKFMVNNWNCKFVDKLGIFAKPFYIKNNYKLT